MSDTLRDRAITAFGEGYEIDAEIGRGGMGVVYRCRDVKLRRFVAIKVLPPDLAFRDEVRVRFLREAETAAQLNHPNIVPIFSVDERDGMVWFVMGLVDGESLAGRLVREHVPASRDTEARVVERFLAAWEAVDVDAIVDLLADDAVMTMPPEALRVVGREIGDFFRTVPAAGALDKIVADILIANAAKGSGMSVDGFEEAEISKRVRQVNDADVQSFYKANINEMGGRTFEQAAPLINRFLQEQYRNTARESLINDLKMKGPAVRVMMEAPRHEVPLAAGDPSRGNASAPVTIVEFSDFQCPYCLRASPTLTQLQKKYGDKVRVVWKDFPLTQIHPDAFRAAEAAHCAGEQGKFWEYHDLLFGNQKALQPSDLTKYAADAKLDTKRFDACVMSSTFTDRVQAGLKLALWPRASLAHDVGLQVAKASATEFSLGHNVASKAEVDAVMNQAKKAGAVIAKPARDTFWGGYAGYFQDPDGHLWEVAWNPQWTVPD